MGNRPEVVTYTSRTVVPGERSASMPTLKEAVLARKLVLKDGVRTLKDSIIDREEFVCPVPSEFSVVLGFIVRGQPDEKFSVSTDVLSHMGKPIWSASDTLEIGPAGSLETYATINIPVLAVGPCYILLKVDNVEVWKQRIFFARARA
jgi:hypothetical protein